VGGVEKPKKLNRSQGKILCVRGGGDRLDERKG